VSFHPVSDLQANSNGLILQHANPMYANRHSSVAFVVQQQLQLSRNLVLSLLKVSENMVMSGPIFLLNPLATALAMSLTSS
jgi:hypothetical protein